jgi:ligand-binding SRPBCC domain-containing protein
MNRNSARLLAQNPQILKRLAKYMAQQCFRNTVLEDFHAGITPYSEAGDYSDVVVKTPAGTIPWSKLSRLNDQEMKTLMIDVVNRTYLLLQTLFDEEVGSYLIRTLSQQDLMPNWNDPQ